MQRRPRTSTRTYSLFPYMTLFRSRTRDRRRDCRLRARIPRRLRRGHRSARRSAGADPVGQRRLLARAPLVSRLHTRERLTHMTAPTFSRLSTLADPDPLPALSHEYIRSQPGLGLGALDPAPRILILYRSLRCRSYSRLVVEV